VPLDLKDKRVSPSIADLLVDLVFSVLSKIVRMAPKARLKISNTWTDPIVAPSKDEQL